MPKQLTCDTCNEPIEPGEDYFALPCGEHVHRDCIDDWARLYLRTMDYEEDADDD